MRCDWCDEPIEGRYLEYEGGASCCVRCKERLPGCRLCGLPLRERELAQEICARCAARAVRCAACEAVIIGRYVKHDDGQALCMRCHERLPKCARCGRAFVEGRTEEGQPLCEVCARVGERCDLCGRVCIGRYWTHPTVGTVCAGCHERARRCDRCQAPLRRGRAVEGGEGRAELCDRCWDEVERCFCCGAPLVGGHYVNERAPERKFCSGCMERRDRCDFCALPLVSAGHAYPDGRLSCEACRATAVVDPAELRDLEGQARAWLTGAVGLTLRPPQACPVRLADAQEIAELQRKRFVATPGFDARERGLFSAKLRQRVRGDRIVATEEELAIHIEAGLPRNEALGTLVHELTHLWQHDNFPRGREVDPRYVEGLACWLQHRALLERGAAAEARVLAENPDPIYGGGLRLVQELARSGGTAADADRTVQEVLRRV